MPHELISFISTPTLPAAYSSRLTRGACLWMFHADEFYAVIDQQPICVEQSMQLMATGKFNRDYDMQYVYAASLYYRPSRNPHGPSKRPIYVAALEHCRFSCEYEQPGFFGRIMGAKPRPLSVFLGLFTANGHENFGVRDNQFTHESARTVLLEVLAPRVRLAPSDFKPCADSAKGPDCPEIA